MERCQNVRFLITLRDCCAAKQKQKKYVCHVIDVHVFKENRYSRSHSHPCHPRGFLVLVLLRSLACSPCA